MDISDIYVLLYMCNNRRATIPIMPSYNEYTPIHMSFISILYPAERGRGGGGGQQSFIRRGSTLRSNPFPLPHLSIFIILTEKVALFYTFQTAVNALSLKYEETANQRGFFDFLKIQNASVIPFGPSYRPKRLDFPILSYGSGNK